MLEITKDQSSQNFTNGSIRKNNILPNFGRKLTIGSLWKFCRPAPASHSKRQMICCFGRHLSGSLFA